MKLTDNYQFKMPDGNDTVKISDLNENTSKIDALFEGLDKNKADLDTLGRVPPHQLPDIDCGGFSPVAHAMDAFAHQNLSIDGNAQSAPVDQNTAHEIDPFAHQNLYIDGGNIK